MSKYVKFEHEYVKFEPFLLGTSGPLSSRASIKFHEEINKTPKGFCPPPPPGCFVVVKLRTQMIDCLNVS